MELVELNKEEYTSFVNNNNAHFLQSYEWGEIAKYRKYDVFYLGLKDNDKVLATALVLKKNLPLNYSYFYIPRGYTVDYADRNLVKTFTLKMKEFAKKHKALFFKIDPDIKLHTIDNEAKVIDGENNYELVDYLKKIGYKHKRLNYYFENMQPRFTYRIKLNDSIEEIENKYTKTTNARIKKAINSEVSVKIGNKEDVKEFVRLMKMTEKRQNFYSHEEEYYSYFYDVFSKSNMVTLYLGSINVSKLRLKLNNELEVLEKEYDEIKDLTSKKANGRKKELEKNINSIKEQLLAIKNIDKDEIIVSSYLTVKYNDKAWALYAANDMEYKKMFANYLVYQKQIRDSFNDNRKVFDVFGTIGIPSSDSHLVGLNDFKKKWGGEYTEFIGEFDYILKPFIYFVYKVFIPLRHKLVNMKLRKSGK